MKYKEYLIIFLSLLSGFCSQKRIYISDPNFKVIKVLHQNLEREAILYYPENYEKVNFTLHPKVHTFPLVIGLHGGNSNPESLIQLTKGRILKYKDQYQFFLLLPGGYKGYWNDGRDISFLHSQKLNIDDAGFLMKLILYLKKHYPLDDSHVYLFGISNGGMMAFRFACEYPHMVRGIASVAATMPENLPSRCQSGINKRFHFILMHGTKDPLVPFNGGEVKVLFRSRGRVISAEETIQFWKARMECFDSGQIAMNSQDKKTYTEIISYTCKNKSQIHFYKIHNGGHTWPGGLQYLPEWFVGKTSEEFWADDVIFRNFFSDKL